MKTSVDKSKKILEKSPRRRKKGKSEIKKIVNEKICNQRNDRKYSDTWRLNNTLLNDEWVIEEIRRK
jgi:hypothetical protein